MNSELYGNEYTIPDKILTSINVALINNPNDEGIKRAKYLLNNKKLSYSNLKRIKNFFDHYSPAINSEAQFQLNGGVKMKNWIDSVLNTERKSVETSKEVRQDMSDNNVNKDLKINNDISRSIHEDINDNNQNNNVLDNPDIKNCAIAIIFNNDRKILLVKRSENSDWMPERWALVGGSIEQNESPLDAIKREIFEETGIKIDKINEKFCIDRNIVDVKEYVFTAKFDGQDNDVVLNEEHSAYGFFNFNEIMMLDLVPNIISYIDIAIKDYNE
jgi:8-oxo-dGTP diphosphatase